MPASLARELRGDGPGAALLLHGFTQTARCWGPFADLLALRQPTVLVDLPGHGASDAVAAGPWVTADLLRGVAHETGGPVDVVGYSMGGRMALHLAIASPEAVRTLVLIGATAGIEDPSERSARRARDEERARSLEHDGVGPFVDRWLAQPLFGGLPADRRFREERLTNTVDGLARSLRTCGTGAQEPLWERLGELGHDTLLVHGAQDPTFGAHAARLARAIPRGEAVAVPGAGHACHLEAPEATAEIVVDFLTRRGPGPPRAARRRRPGAGPSHPAPG